MSEPELAEPVEVLTIDWPERRNALSRKVSAELIARVPLEPPPGRRCYLLHGAGSVFCSGGDLSSERSALQEGAADADEFTGYELLDRLVAQPLPVIAWLNGPAVGGGALLAMGADLRLVASSAYLSIPAAKLGICFNAHEVESLVGVVGRHVATDLLVATRKLDAETMLALRLATDRAETLAEAERFAGSFAELAPLSLRGHRRALQGNVEESTRIAEQALQSLDMREGLDAFLERRPPRFSGK